jgi:hypothetical protein
VLHVRWLLGPENNLAGNYREWKFLSKFSLENLYFFLSVIVEESFDFIASNSWDFSGMTEKAGFRFLP